MVMFVCSLLCVSLMMSCFGSEFGIIDWIYFNCEFEFGFDLEWFIWLELF